MTTSNLAGDLNLGHIFAAAGLDVSELVVLRHTYTSGGLIPGQVTPAAVLAYTRRQDLSNKVGKTPPPLWLCFMADGQRRSRFRVAYENHGEVLEERTARLRYFDLRPSDALSALMDRLVIEWSKDAVNWAKLGASASSFPVVEIADPHAVAFPGFDQILITYSQLLAMVEDSRYAAWRTALQSVQGIYLIADSSTGRLYVGRADGAERIFGRWMAYARDGHGGNMAMKDLIGLDSTHRQHFVFSILRVFGPATHTSEIDQAEAHYKQALLSRIHGLNRN